MSRLLFIIIFAPVIGILLAAPILPGSTSWIAAAYMMFCASFWDLGIEDQFESMESDPAIAAYLPRALGLLHFLVLPIAISTLLATHSSFHFICWFLAFGLYFGMVGNAVAHELIHRKSLLPATLGRMMFTTMGIGHHVSSHLLVHHIHAATPNDPYTARKGQSFYSFVRQVFIGGFRDGLKAETNRAYRRGRLNDIHPYTIYTVGAVATLTAALWFFGTRGAVIYVCLATFSNSHLILIDYIQHYGLRRERKPDGSYAPMTEAHSWNAPYWFSNRFMIGAPSHSAHHVSPAKRFDMLKVSSTAPCHPYPTQIMAFIALVPPLWFKVMDGSPKRFSAKRPV